MDTPARTAASICPAFVKQVTVQEASAPGLQTLGPVARTLARLESLDAHANAVSVRLEALAAGMPP